MQTPLTLVRPEAHDPLPRPIGPGVVLMAAGGALVCAVFLGSAPTTGVAPLSLYGLGLLAIGLLAWWEATRRRAGVLPSWTSPPALIAAWTLGWIYLPSLAVFVDDNLLDDVLVAQGGEEVVLAGLPLTCVALAALSVSYHAVGLTLGRRTASVTRTGLPVAVRRVAALYLVSAAARLLRLATLGIAFGADLAAWGPLRSVDQWIGYVEDLRFLALTLLVALVIRRRAGRLWLVLPVVVELIFGATSGFMKPFIWPVLLCVATAAVFDRFRGRHLVLLGATALAVSTFVPVVAAIREDRTGTIGTTVEDGLAGAIAAPGRYWLGGVSSGDGAYHKFFGRQAEVASAMGLVRLFTPAVVPFEGLGQFLRMPAYLIPRVIWPEKPTLSRGVWFSVTFRGLDEDTSSSSAMTIFSEGYVFFGWTGVALGMLLVGALLAVLRHRLDNARFAPVYLALLPTILEIEPELSSYVISLVQRSLVFVAVFVVLTHTRAARPGPPVR